MPNISQYTKEALENSGNTIRNYQQQEAYGVITIKYDLVDSGRGAAIGVGIGAFAGLAGFTLCIPIAGPAVLATAAISGIWGAPIAGAVVGNAVGSTTEKIHYFDVATGDLLGNSRNEAADKLHEKGLALRNNGDYACAANKFNAAYQKCTNGYQNN